ncbi:MAG TPA: hypothetical protein VEC11_01380 [Allosphingosinicella sp.]|nr:hypothetical protein [Allosphingosinicella sp.]
MNLTATTTQLAMPSGESTAAPGWDGEVHSPAGNAWVPAGHSCWEVSCEADVAAKANRDFNKRTEGYPQEYRSTRSFIFVTPRRWRGKAAWAEQERAKGLWADVRAYDADDLEQWLENSPALALAFAEELGLSGPGVESLKAFLQKWLAQSRPALSVEALLTGRSAQSDVLLGKIDKLSPEVPPTPISLKADSVEEATAFAAAAIGQREELADAAVVITTRDGWRFVEKNDEIEIAIAASPKLAESPTVRNGLAVVVPFASGDMARQFEGLAARLDEDELHLERPDHHEFEEALKQIGVEENDAHRLSVQCGRSWSVFRRQHAINPAIRRPEWLDHEASSALSAVCLLGAWSSAKDADKEVVERVSGLPYEQLETKLLELERLDDSPVLHIGEVWKAKSALELLALFGDRITDEQIDRFFGVCEALLGAPDPQLELPEEERYAAAIHGKVRPVSGLLLNAICDTLIKLAVRGPEIPSLAAKNIELRVDRVVRSLLRDADETRWLSLSSHLPALAEASPEEFLSAVERSLDSQNSPVRRMLTESRTTHMGRCWHAGLLWALETLAWAPQRLSRVSIILARLTETKIEGNWGNNPMSSLVDLYRSWLPQTSASIRQRIAALDVLIKRVPEAAYQLLNALVNVGHDTASPTSRPKWRDDDAGSGRGVTHGERHEMVMAALDRQIAMASGDASRVANLLNKLSHFDAELADRVLALLPAFETGEDADKETLRDALRGKIHWHRNYDERDIAVVDAFLKPLEDAYARLTPDDLIVRHAWLVTDGWPRPPVRTREEDFKGKQDLVTTLRNEAVAEIFAERGWEGLQILAECTKAGWNIGLAISQQGLSLAELATWIVEASGSLESGDQLTSLTGGILCGLPNEQREEVLDRVLEKADQSGLSFEWKVRLVVLCPDGPAIWKRVATWGEEAESLYWQSCHARFWLEDDPDNHRFAILKLIEVRRGATAFDTLHGKFSQFEPDFILQMLEAITASAPGDLPRMEGYWIQQAFAHLEKAEGIDRARLARLEFSLFPVFSYDGEDQAVSLYRELMSTPATFIELLSLIYRRQNCEPREADEATKGAAATAWRVLRACKRQPGAADDGSIDPQEFSSFIEETRRLAESVDRTVVCDITLGEILAHSPDGADGVWPFESARDVLEGTPGDDMLSGFQTGSFNKRGAYSKGVFDGGVQERELAAYYRRHAVALEVSHPRVAATLHSLAKSYDRHGLLEDLDVRLRREGH